MSNSKQSDNSSVIVVNKKATHEYFIEDRIEAGLALEGWEVKSLRANKVHLVDCYVFLKSNEAWLLGMHIDPLPTASTHITPEPTRTRKLLLHAKEIAKLIGAKERDGYTIVPTKLYWARGRVKVEIAIAKGKKQHDKRASLKDREWTRTKDRVMKQKR